MNFRFLIDAIVRQTTILIAQLATVGGIRSPLAHIANQVFVELASELERQGLSRKVTADMFGITLRAYQRKMQRIRESSTERGTSLWEAVLKFLEEKSVVTRIEILQHFYRDDEETVRGILRDLVKSGLLFCSGTEDDTVYRMTTDEELYEIRNRHHGVDDLLWAIIFREDPIRHERLCELVNIPAAEIDKVVDRLINLGRVSVQQRSDGAYYASENLVISNDTTFGWEASIYDHFQAMVKTICKRLEKDSSDSDEGSREDSIGGSTYTFDVGEGHPLESEVLDTLRLFRERCTDLRRQVNSYNQTHGYHYPRKSVLAYAGQCVFPFEEDSFDHSSTEANK